jgi:hypothetical protein
MEALVSLLRFLVIGLLAAWGYTGVWVLIHGFPPNTPENSTKAWKFASIITAVSLLGIPLLITGIVAFTNWNYIALSYYYGYYLLYFILVWVIGVLIKFTGR